MGTFGNLQSSFKDIKENKDNYKVVGKSKRLLWEEQISYACLKDHSGKLKANWGNLHYCLGFVEDNLGFFEKCEELLEIGLSLRRIQGTYVSGNVWKLYKPFWGGN